MRCLCCLLLASGCGLLYEETARPDPEALRVDRTELTLGVGATDHLTASFATGDEPGWATWTARDPDIVSLSYFDEGVVTVRGLRVGVGTAEASLDEVARIVTITVVPE